MLVKFTTKSYPDIVMFGNVAKKLIKMTGHSGTVPSAILADEVPAYRDRLIEALAGIDEGEASNNKQTNKDGEPVISLKQRAQPLIELFDAAIENKDIVTWKQG